MGKLSENSDRGGRKWNKSVKMEEEGCNPPPCSQCGGCSDTDFSRKKICSDMLSSGSRPQRRRRVFDGGDDERSPSSRSRVEEGRSCCWRGGRSRMDPWFVMMLLSVCLFVISSIVIGVGGVDAIDLNPHGGFYHREGGNDFYAPQQQQQQSDFGGDDMIMTCSRPSKSSRAAKYLAIKKLDIPCDMQDKKSAWCNLPGDKYPWHAVRRFVFENQGLMRRMYGEVRQLSLLRMEFDDDMDEDDEFEHERHGPSRSPPLPEDHRRNSILTEFDESLPRILSETPPEDQILLRDHLVRSTPRTLSTLSTSPLPPSMSTSGSSATPMMASSSEELLTRGNNDTTEVMITVTADATSEERNSTGAAATTGGIVDLTETSVMMGSGDGDVTPSIGNSMRMNGLLEELVTTEEATQATADTTETEANGDEEVTLVTTTEEMLAIGEDSGLGLVQEQVGAVTQQEMQSPQQQLNDGLDIGATGGIGSDESHDFLNLDKNHILYFDDVGKNRRPAAGNNGNGAGDSEGGYVPSQDQQQQQPGKLKAVNACPVKEEVVAPYWANNTRGEILALLNLYPFEQYIHWERCNHENKQMFCRQGCRCEQQYRLHRLLAFDPTNECRGIFSDWFRFPSCCVCRCYLNEYELMMLNAAGQEPSASSAQSKSRTSDRIRSPRNLLLDQLVDGPDVQGVDDMHFFYKQGVYTEHNHGAQPRRKR